MRKTTIRLYTGVGVVPDTVVCKNSVRRKPYRNSRQIDCIKRTRKHNNSILSFIVKDGGIDL